MNKRGRSAPTTLVRRIRRRQGHPSLTVASGCPPRTTTPKNRSGCLRAPRRASAPPFMDACNVFQDGSQIDPMNRFASCKKTDFGTPIAANALRSRRSARPRPPPERAGSTRLQPIRHRCRSAPGWRAMTLRARSLTRQSARNHLGRRNSAPGLSARTAARNACSVFST